MGVNTTRSIRTEGTPIVTSLNEEVGKPRDSSNQANALLVAPKRPFSVLSGKVVNISIPTDGSRSCWLAKRVKRVEASKSLGEEGAVFGAKVSVCLARNHERREGNEGRKKQTTI